MTEQDRAAPLDVAARACCCPARPVVTVVMPPTASRMHPVELLLCGHHFRTSQASLRAAGAAAYDKTGVRIMTGTRAEDTSGLSVGGLVATGHSRRKLYGELT
jgi:hypothetical protein